MDVDATNQSAPPISSARPTATDPCLNRDASTSRNSPQSNKAPCSPTSSSNPTTSLPEQQNASNSPSTGCPPGSNGLHPAEEPDSAPIRDLGDIVPLLTQLVDSRVGIGLRQRERPGLEREDALLRKTLSRAKALPASFPSLVDSVQSMKDSQTGLQKLDAELTKHQALCSDIAEELRVMLRAASCISKNDKGMKLATKLKEEWKAEFKEWKPELQEESKAEFKEEWKAEFEEKWKAELKEEMAGLEKRLEAKIRSNMETELKEKLSDLREELRAELKQNQSASTAPSDESQDAVPSEFEEKFSRLENSVNFVSASNRNLSTQISRVDKWKKDVEEGRIPLPSQSEAPAGSSSQANPDLEKLKEQVPTLETRLGKVEHQHSEWSSLQSLVNENTATLHLLKSSHELAQKAEQGKFTALEAQIQQIQEQVAELKGVAEELQKRSDAINTVFSRIDACLKTQDTMTVALRSLEHRYLNINSEELVKSMANAMYEMYPGMQKVHDQLKSLQVQFNTCKDEVTKEFERLKSSVDNEEKASVAVALQEFKQISERFDQLQETQKLQADDIVRHLEEVKELQNQLDGHSHALAEFADKQADEVSDLSEEIKALVARFGEYHTRLEEQAKQCKDLEGSSHRARTQLDTLKEFTSEDNIRRICEDAQREKLQVITGQMEEFNSQGMSLLKRLKDIQHQGFGSSGQSPESLQSLTNGQLSASGMDGSTTTPQNTQSPNLSGRPQLPAAAQASSNTEAPTNAPKIPTDPRILLPKSASSTPSPGAVGGSFGIKGAASQNDPERGQTSSNSQSGPQKTSRDAPMSSRITANPPSPTVTNSQNRSSTTGPDHPTTSSAPSNGASPNPPTQASAGKKRPRQPTISDDESREERRANPVSSNTANPSPAPSSASDIPLRKSKKAKKKEKRQSQLK